MPEKRTIRDVNIQHRRPRPGATKQSESSVEAEPARSGPGPKRPTKKVQERRRERGTMWTIAFLALAILGIFLASVFGKTTITLWPEQADGEINMTIAAGRSAGNDELRFDLMSIEDSISEEVPATASGEVERKASGTIVIYNENSSSQNLREETRFESPDGLIYKTAKGAGITVPGANGGAPGSLEVTVYADEPGAEYNIGLVDFVIPGWREINNPKFETQYARSKTPMTGGFVGIEKTVDPDEQARVEAALGEALTQRLLMSAGAQKTDQFIFFEDGVVITLAEIAQGEASEESVSLVAEGTLSAILFNKEELSKTVATEVLDNYDGEPIMITNFEDLEFTLNNAESFSVTATNEISFELVGTPHFEWVVDMEALASALQGVHKRAFPETLEGFSGIQKAELSISPFWKSKIADDVKKIEVELEGSKL